MTTVILCQLIDIWKPQCENCAGPIDTRHSLRYRKVEKRALIRLSLHLNPDQDIKNTSDGRFPDFASVHNVIMNVGFDRKALNPVHQTLPVAG